MAMRKFKCKEKCYYANRLWRPARQGVDADVMDTDRTDVNLDHWELIEGKTTARKHSTRIKGASKLPAPERKKTGEEPTLEDLL